MPQHSTNVRQHNQTKTYKHNNQVSLVIRQSSPNELYNQQEKEKFQNLVMKSAMGLFKNYKRRSKEVQRDTDEFVTFVAKNMDGKTFALFNKYLNELKHDVLAHKT